MVGTPQHFLESDAENRLVGVSGAATAAFTGVYPERSRRNGDGNRVKSVEGGVTTVYIGSYYEWTSAGSTRYYYAGGQRVAMRREGYSSYNGLYYLVSDHLGSTSLVLNSSGTIVQQTKYKPWGEVRSGSITLTDFGFTGQRAETSLGLAFYVSRYYDSYNAFVPEKATNGFKQNYNPRDENQIRHFLAGASIADNLGPPGIVYVRIGENQPEDNALYGAAMMYVHFQVNNPLSAAGDWVLNNLAK